MTIYLPAWHVHPTHLQALPTLCFFSSSPPLPTRDLYARTCFPKTRPKSHGSVPWVNCANPYLETEFCRGEPLIIGIYPRNTHYKRCIWGWLSRVPRVPPFSLILRLQVGDPKHFCFTVSPTLIPTDTGKTYCNTWVNNLREPYNVAEKHRKGQF